MIRFSAVIALAASLSAVASPATAQVEPVIDTPAVAAIEERPAPEKPAVATAPTKSGPVIRTIPTD